MRMSRLGSGMQCGCIVGDESDLLSDGHDLVVRRYLHNEPTALTAALRLGCPVAASACLSQPRGPELCPAAKSSSFCFDHFTTSHDNCSRLPLPP